MSSWLLRSLNSSHHLGNEIEDLSGLSVTMGKLRHRQAMGLSKKPWHSCEGAAHPDRCPAPSRAVLQLSRQGHTAQEGCWSPRAVPALQCPPCAAPRLLPQAEQSSHWAKTRHTSSAQPSVAAATRRRGGRSASQPLPRRASPRRCELWTERLINK